MNAVATKVKDLKKVPLLKALAQEKSGPDKSGPKLSQAFFDTTSIFDLFVAGAKQEIKKLWREIGNNREVHLDRIGKIRKKLDLTLNDFRRVKQESQDGLPLEKSYFDQEISKLGAETSRLQRLIEEMTNPLEDIRRQGSCLARDVRPRLQQIKKAFPDAQHFDWGSIGNFLLPNGLPRLGIFTTKDTYCEYGVFHGGLAIGGDRDRFFPQSFHNFPLKELYDRILSVCDVTLGGRRDSYVKITSDFSQISGAIPREARDLIKKAEVSKVFERVVLVAEVNSWEVTYYDVLGKPKIEGKVITPQQSKDPLIIGIKEISGRKFGFLLGAFDVTPLEDLLRAEYATKIEE